MADIDLQGTDASYSFGDGAIFQRVDPTLSGTGLYDPFLTVQDSPTEQGYNTNQLGQLDNVYSSGGSGGRTDAVTLSQIPIKIVDGVAYYEFRVDLNEPNSDPVISLERLELYKSSAPADSSDFQGTSAADAFLASDGFTKIFDLDSGGDNRLVLSDVTSSGSGRDDYRLLVPVSSFGNIDPTQTYLTMYTDFGQAGSNFDSRATFEEWHTQANATVSGVKFLDSDRDGVKDSGEVGMGGVTVFIDDNRNGVLDLNERSTITASDGTFTFYGVTTTWSDHNVHVAEVVPTGYDRTTGDYEVAAVVNGGISYVEIGNAPQVGSISGTKMADTDNNDTGDTPVAGWTISLYQDDNGNGQIDSGDDLITSTTTAADGSYSFANLTPGTYIVQEEVQSGWQAITDVTQGATVVSATDTTVDFVNEQLGSISGTKLADTDNNDTGDTPVDGWGVTLYNDLDHSGTVTAGDTIAGTTTTDASGDYSFSGLAPGDYVVEEETRTGWQALTPTDVALTVSAGGTATADFVNEQLAALSGYKFSDLNNNGVWDQGSGETGVAGWSIYLYNDNGDGVLGAGDTLADSTTTDSSGYYEFGDLAPGKYIIVEGTQSGWTQTAPNGSDADPESTDVNGSGSGYAEYGYAIDLTAGTENEDNNFGNYMIPGPGVRTPGFWGSPNGLTFWDGIVGNEAKSGPNFPSGELAPDGYLILGDDGDGIVETGELKISLTDAHKLIDASNKHGGDAGFMLARDVIATWLNYLAGNPIGSESDTCSPAYWLQEGVDWLIKYENNNHSGASDPLTFSDITSHHVKSTSAAWTVGVSDDGIESGKDIHSALDEYNNTGMHCGIQYATDADSEFSSLEVLSANSMMAFGHHHAGDYMF
ncbi:MAG: MSCRAMM family protein [Parcubacteria group bacterium]